MGKQGRMANYSRQLTDGFQLEFTADDISYWHRIPPGSFCAVLGVRGIEITSEGVNYKQSPESAPLPQLFDFPAVSGDRANADLQR